MYHHHHHHHDHHIFIEHPYVLITVLNAGKAAAGVGVGKIIMIDET